MTAGRVRGIGGGRRLFDGVIRDGVLISMTWHPTAAISRSATERYATL